jgi:cell division protein FtsL
MIILATVAICSTVIVRTRAELRGASLRHDRVTSEIDSMRRSNAALALEVRRITTDPGAIEAAARDRLGMVRPNDIVVPIEALQSASKSRMFRTSAN